LVDRESVWHRVLVARYGEVGGRVLAGGRGGSSWWRDISRIRNGVGFEGGAGGGARNLKLGGPSTKNISFSETLVTFWPNFESPRPLYVENRRVNTKRERQLTK